MSPFGNSSKNVAVLAVEQLRLFSRLLLFWIFVPSLYYSAEARRDTHGLTLHQIQNASFRVPSISGEGPGDLVKLTGGKFKDGDYTVQLVEVAFGDLDGDGLADAAAIYYSNSGGTGCFEELTVFRNCSGTPISIATKDIGDRVGIKALKIKSRTIFLDAITHSSKDPAGSPSLSKTVKYKLKNNKLYGPDSLYN